MNMVPNGCDDTEGIATTDADYTFVAMLQNMNLFVLHKRKAWITPF